jgi:hypothetical protein
MVDRDGMRPSVVDLFHSVTTFFKPDPNSDWVPSSPIFGLGRDPNELQFAGFNPLGIIDTLSEERELARQWVKVALEQALDALKKPECASLFGTENSRASGWDPVTALQTIYSDSGGYIGGSGTYVGSSVYNGWPLAAVATAGPAVFFGGKTGGVAAGWRVELNAGSAIEMGTISKEYLAAGLLHEMGHIYQLLAGKGSGGSSIRYDGLSSKQSNANQDLVLKKCFGL